MKYNPDIHHRCSIRLKDYDYLQEWAYFVTVCVDGWECLFGGWGVDMKEKIYLETSVISAYFDFREQFPDKKLETRKFWHNVLPKFEVFVSSVTIKELAQSPTEKGEFLKLVLGFEELKISVDVENLVEKYVKQKIFPETMRPDALHIAIASVYKMDFLVSWNQKHITRPHRRKIIREFNERYELFVPEITTPEEMLEEV